MFSGKSEELIRRLRRAQIAQKVQIFKPAIDLRYSDQHIISHSEMKIASQIGQVGQRDSGDGRD